METGERKGEAVNIHVTLEDAARWLASLEEDDEVAVLAQQDRGIHRMEVLATFLAGADAQMRKLAQVALPAKGTQ